MGLWGAVKSLAKKGKEKVKKAAKKAKDNVTNVWNKFSGKKDFAEAEKLYDKITDKYNNRKKDFENEVNKLSNDIENSVSKINDHKLLIKGTLFPEMAKKLAKIKNININKEFSIEEYKFNEKNFESIRKKDELYQIDFNKNKFKTTVQSIFTLGFYTRKKAKETLYAVQEEEKKIETEIKKMDKKLVKLRRIAESIKQVEYYFDNVINLYKQLLVRLKNSINFLYLNSMQFAHKLDYDLMSIKKLPVINQKEIKAIITSSITLKKMTDTNIVSLEENKKVDNFVEEIENCHNEITKKYKAA